MTSPAWQVLAVIFACSGVAFAQQEETPKEHFAAVRAKIAEDVRERLKSEDLATVAWAAHTSAEFRLDGCVPELRAKLASLAKRAGKERDHAALALLDALIQANANVPGAEIEPFLRDITWSASLALLRKRPVVNAAQLLLAFQRAGAGSTKSRDCGELLAELRCRGFAAALLRVPFPIYVLVCDPGEEQQHGNDDLLFAGSHRTSCYRLERLATLSPQVGYTIEKDASRRFLFGDRYCESEDEGPVVDLYRTDWMRKLLQRPDSDTASKLSRERIVPWSDGATLLAIEEEESEQAEKHHRELVALCVEAKLIDPETAASLRPEFRVIRYDRRTDASVPLPER